MVRKKARVKMSPYVSCCCRRIGCECSIGLLFFLSASLAVSFLIFLVVTAAIQQPVWQLGQPCERGDLLSDIAERSGSYRHGFDQPIQATYGAKPSLKPVVFQFTAGFGDEVNDFNNLPDEKWVDFMHSLGLVSALEQTRTTPSGKPDSNGQNKLSGCSEKCMSSSEISPFRQWRLFFRALVMFRTLWDKQSWNPPRCKFILDMEKASTFYKSSTKLIYSDASNDHIIFDPIMRCQVNVSGSIQKARFVYEGVFRDLTFQRRQLLSAEETKNIASRIWITCGTRTSCLRTDITIENHPKVHPLAANRRRLLAIADDVNGSDVSYPVAVMCGLSSFVIIFIAILCVCNKKTSTNDDPDIMLKQVTPRVDRRSINIEACAAPVNNERHSVHVTIEEKRKSAGPIAIAENGPYQLGHHRNDSRSSARGGTLDRRLPAIPMVEPTPPSCDDEIDDTYDTIAPTKIAAQNKNDYDTRTDTSDSKTDEGSLRYEPVRMRDDVYAEVTDVKQPEEERRVSPNGVRLDVEETYEFVGKHAAGMSKEEKRLSQMQRERINRESPYSRLPGDESELSGDGVIQRPLSQIEPLPQNSLPRTQSEEVYEMYDTVADESARNSRSFDSNEEEFIEDDNYASVDPPPPVPDRQYSPEEVASHSSGAQSPASPTRNDRNSVVLPPLVGPGAALPVPGDAAMSDPPYSQVTARESLASIRERQHQGMSPVIVNEYDLVDNVYEPVDDQPETNRGRAQTLPVSDGAGDWYSEIDCTATARPSDEDPDVLASSPVEPRGRSFTTGHAPNNIDDLYADVDKSKKTSRRPPEDLPVTVEIVSTGTKDVHPYAVVDKSKKKKNRMNNDENAPPIASPENYNDPAVPPKIKAFAGVQEIDESAGRESLDSSGYQTVDEVKLEMERSLEEADMNLKSPNGHVSDDQGEPGYATVADDEEIDTTYDEITLENGNITNGATSDEKEQMFHMSNHKVAEDFWVRREPVYSEVDEDDSPTIIPVTVL